MVSQTIEIIATPRFFFLLCFASSLFRYELQQRGLLHDEDIGVVPDIYSRNSDLDSEVKFLKTEVNKFRNAAL